MSGSGSGFIKEFSLITTLRLQSPLENKNKYLIIFKRPIMMFFLIIHFFNPTLSLDLVTGETGATGVTVVAGGIDETGIVGATDIVGFFS
jgi:hypothetical protein